ncbi:TonB-dependent receptor [Plebeiibacterium sediminum]|uniref:TonB-dependent receptor n=1 Tax=Plebeiibacterium sediminum TaxID=2992112 RepID=A0AAE3SDN5_9BACT|nr:TonB-dependent receptor [Plebeiobacterium sediminum]MCW3785206.1 TonB-dependent receptor [Plebeiobacterium sediminum]
MNKIIICIQLLVFITINSFAKPGVPPIQGEITNGKDPIPFATVQLKSTTIGSASDLDGKFYLVDIPEGKHTLVIQALGHVTKEVDINLSYDHPLNLDISLEEDVLGLEQVVVTADKTQKRRIDASNIVNTMTPKQLTQVQAVTLSEGLNFTTGLRMENNCQNCGANQLRMNGMEGSYSQILVNGRSIFSGLASVYGLEMIPANMIQQIEVVKGGGSALYGSNAIAGTVNLITKEPLNNIFEASIQNGRIGINDKAKNDLNININTAIVSEDKNSGLSLYATHRKREGYDANNDSFTELSKLNNNTFGANLYHRMGYRNKLTLDYFHIEEERRGGDMLDALEHEANITESANHKINTGSATFTRFIGENNGQLSVYASAQNVDRSTYYGARSYASDYIFDLPMNNPEQLSDGTPDLSAYGITQDLSYSYGVQFKGGVGRHSYITGIENVGSNLEDKKLGYTDSEGYHDEVIISDQKMNTIGLFGQYDYEFNKMTVSAGVRLDNYNIKNKADDSDDLSNTVISPRLNLLYKPLKQLQVRGSFSTGYRAPQIFDEDLHIEIAGNRKVIHANGKNLKQESSYSFVGSMDYQGKIGTSNFEILGEYFYTNLTDAFANEQSAPDENGTVTYTRINGGKAFVNGLNIEARYFPSANWDFEIGFTTQVSKYDDAQEYGISNFTKDYLRTPNNYGYFTLNTDPLKNFSVSLNGTYTGSMKIEYYGNNSNGEILDTQDFYDVGLKGEYFFRFNKGFDLGISCGIKNIFNSYQNDFDKGINRDPAYIYGPSLPQSVYFGIRVGNLL